MDNNGHRVLILDSSLLTRRLYTIIMGGYSFREQATKLIEKRQAPDMTGTRLILCNMIPKLTEDWRTCDIKSPPRDQSIDLVAVVSSRI